MGGFCNTPLIDFQTVCNTCIISALSLLKGGTTLVPIGPWQLLESAVDYYAGFTPDEEVGNRVEEWARELISNDNLGDDNGSGWSEQGFTGVKSAHAFTGRRDDGTFVRFSTARHSDVWRRAYSDGLRASRVDVQCTALGPSDDPDLAERIFHSNRLPTRNRGVSAKLEIYSAEDGGSTLYVGSRKSSIRGRLYDKGRESGGDYPNGSWRWEVQFRHRFAEDLVVHLVGGPSVEQIIGSVVNDYFASRGIPCHVGSPIDGQKLVFTRTTSDDERRFEYLRRSIAPMVAGLRGRYSVRELRMVLGLQYHPGEASIREGRSA